MSAFSIATIALATIAMLVLSCGDPGVEPAPPPPAPVATTLTVTPATAELGALGATVRLSAEVRDQIGRPMEDVTVSWSSADTLVVTVDSAGLVTAAGGGAATIKATAGDAAGAAIVTVMQSAASVAVSPPADTIALGDTLRLAAQAFDENGHRVLDAVFLWASSDVAVVRVDESGLVTGVGEGRATVTARTGDASAAAEVTVENPDRAALVAFYHATGGPNWAKNDNWLSNLPLDDWYGVDTDDSGRVTRLDLAGEWARHGLVGPIPRELANLTELRILSLGVNALTGEIPPELGRLPRLEVLSLGINALDGPIPPEIGKLNRLRQLDVSNNLLSGAIPLELATLTTLESLDLGNVSGTPVGNIYDGSLNANTLTGQIPPELGNLVNLRVLSLTRNSLTGPIPAELGNLVNLRYLSLGTNSLTGPIPAELGNLVNLRDLGLSDNRLTGAIPPELGNLKNIARFSLGYNRLTGPIPAGIGRITSLRRLYLNENQLFGPLPQSFLGLNLEYLRIRPNPGLCVPGTVAFGAWLNEGIEYYHDAGQVQACNADDVSALETFHAATGGSGWTRSDGWMSERPVEEWHGVQADSLGKVVRLDLTDNNLAGELPASLGSLTALAELHLTGNSVTGRLPLGFASLPLNTVLVDPTVCAPSEMAFQSWWTSVPTRLNLPACSPASDRDLLVAVYHALGGDGWYRNDNWLSDQPLSTWYGVRTTSGAEGQAVALDSPSGAGMPDVVPAGYPRAMLLDSASLEEELAEQRSRWSDVDIGEGAIVAPADAWAPVHAPTDGSVVVLDLANNGLAGRMPAEIGYLSNLERLNLFYNDISGPVPSALGDLGVLSVLNLQANDLSGSIPPELGNLRQLTYVSFQANRLEGRIPPELGNLKNLAHLNLSFNQLRGPIPPELGNLVNLDSLNLDAALQGGGAGTIPPALADLANISYLSLVVNDLTGPIPPDLGRLANLRTLRLFGNGLTGPIPPELGSLSKLERLVLGWNELSGTIPPELENLWNLEYLSVTRNQVSGSIPPELGSLTNLEILALGGNDLSGPIPSELGGASSRLQEIYLWGNSFDGGFGSSFGNLANLKVLYAPDAGLSGPVPPSFGQLSSLEWLYLGNNAGMSGELPSTLTALQQLERFLVGGTDLCAPQNPAFKAWLEGVTMQHGVSECGRGIVADAYLVQSVQSARDPVPLVAGRDALLRVFVTADSASDVSVPPVRASFYSDGALVHTIDIAALGAPIPSEPAERSLAASSNARIPGAAIRPGMEMVVEIDPGGTLDPALGIVKRIPAVGRLALDVRELPPFEVKVVPFVPAGGGDRALAQRIQELTVDDPLFRDTRTLLPVNDMTVAVRDPVVTSTNDMFQLLRELEALRVVEGASSYYMGTLAGEWSPNSPGGVALGVPSRSQMSRLDGSIIAHEFGHNLHLYHAPCGNPANTDSGFPDDHGRIGAWGYDFGTESVVSPARADLMTYCDPAWVSPYHFSNALRWRRTSGVGAQSAASAVEGRMLLLWGSADVEGALALDPAFLFNGPASLPDSAGAWRVSGKDTDGTELFALDFHMTEVADGDGRRAFVFAVPADPSWEGRLARIVLSGPDGEVSIEEADRDATMAIVRDSATGRIRGFLRDPADVQVLAGGDPSALAALGLRVDSETIEVTVSRGVPRAVDWRR